jgi:hypothetical protein
MVTITPNLIIYKLNSLFDNDKHYSRYLTQSQQANN